MPALAAGGPVPDFSLHRRVREVVTLGELVADGPVVLHVYLFDFTGSDEGG